MAESIAKTPKAGGMGLDMSLLEGIDIENMTPEMLQQLAALGALGDESSQIDDQYTMAEELRWDEGPQGIETGRGGYVAASPLAHIAETVGNVKAAKDLKQFDERREGIRDEQTEGRALMMQMILGKVLQEQGGEAPYTGMV